MRSFIAVYKLAFIRPGRALAQVCEQPERRALRWGALAVGVTALVYELVYLFLAHNGGRPTVFRPWLAIEAEHYYRFNQFVLIPSVALGWVAAAGFAQLCSRALGGRGSFEQTAAVLGFGISIASWWTGLHDVITTFLGWLGVIDQRAYEDAMSSATPFRTMLWILMIGYAAWFFLMFGKGIAAAHRLTPTRAALAGSVGVVVYQLIFVLFNR